MRFRVHVYGDHRYRVGKTSVHIWDGWTRSWLWIADVASKRDGRLIAAAHAYTKRLNP